MTTTFSISRGDLAKAITIALKFAGKDDTLPMLCGVQLSIHKGYFVIEATDRFRAAIVRIGVKELSAPNVIFGHLDRDTATRLLKVISGGRKAFQTGGIEVEVDGLALSVSDPDTKMTVTLTDTKFPDISKILIEEMKRPVEVENWLSNSAYLATFKDAAWSPNQAASVRLSTPSRPAVIRMGDHFIGLLMPVYPGGDRGPTTDWAGFFTPVLEPEKPKRAPRKRATASASAKAPAKKALAKKAPAKRASRAAK